MQNTRVTVLHGVRLSMGRLAARLERATVRSGWGRQIRRIRPVNLICGRIYRLLQPSTPVSTTILGHKYYVDLRDRGISQHLFLDGIWEKPETEAFLSVLKPGMIVVDVGANTGYYTLLAARAVGVSGKVYSFEPESKNNDLLRRNIATNGYRNVTVVPKVVLDRGGPASFYLSTGHGGGHSVVENRGANKVINVEAITLDDFFDQQQARVDVAKIDAEGAEERVLNGMAGVIARSPSMVLFTEFHPSHLRAAGSSPEEFLRKLDTLGFAFRPFPAPEEQSQPPVRTRHLSDFVESLLRYCAASHFGYVNLACARGAATELPLWQNGLASGRRD